MSRTYRRKNERIPYYQLIDRVWNGWECEDFVPPAKEQIKRIAKFHSEAGHSYRAAVPSWFCNLFRQRPYRRDADRQLQKYLATNGEFEVMIRPYHHHDAGWSWF